MTRFATLPTNAHYQSLMLEDVLMILCPFVCWQIRIAVPVCSLRTLSKTISLRNRKAVGLMGSVLDKI